MIKFDKFFELLYHERRLNKAWLRQNGINSKTINNMSNNQSVSTDSIDKICKLLHCSLDEIMEFVDEEES